MPGGRVLLVNWLGEPLAEQPGDRAAEAFIAAAGLDVARTERAERYRLDLLTAPSAG